MLNLDTKHGVDVADIGRIGAELKMLTSNQSLGISYPFGNHKHNQASFTFLGKVLIQRCALCIFSSLDTCSLCLHLRPVIVFKMFRILARREQPDSHRDIGLHAWRPLGEAPTRQSFLVCAVQRTSTLETRILPSYPHAEGFHKYQSSAYLWCSEICQVVEFM